MTQLTKEEKTQLAKVRQAKLEILFTAKDDNGNFLVYNYGRLYLRLVNEDKNRNIGDICYVNDKIIYKKWEAEAHIFQEMDAWSVPLFIAKNVDVIWFKTPMRDYWISHQMIKQLLKEGEAKILKFQDYEKKVYIPRKYWSPDTILREEPYEITLLAHDPTPMNTKPNQEKYEKRVGEEWAVELYDAFETPYMQSVGKKLAEARKTKTIYPEGSNVFRAFKETPFTKVKVVILGQDPYHDGNATGLAFDCGKYVTPTMREIQNGYNDQYPNNFATDILDGNLERWAQNGVLLLNTALTVRKGEAASHLKQWYPFTAEVIKALNRRNQEPYKLPPVVYLLWGKMAQQYEALVDDSCPVIKTEHPVAGVYSKRKWKHENCFHTVNEKLIKLNVEPIEW